MVFLIRKNVLRFKLSGRRMYISDSVETGGIV